MTRWLAELIDRFLNTIAPLKNIDSAEFLAAFEAERDALEPDELWAARMRKSQTPAGTDRPRTIPPMREWQTPPAGAGGPNLQWPDIWPGKNQK